MMERDRRWVVTREVEDGGVRMLEGLVVPWEVDPTLAWEVLEDQAVEVWGARLDRAGSTSIRAVVDDMLEPFGWERSHGPRGPHHFPIRRAAPRFLARRTGTELTVTTADGVLVAAYEVTDATDAPVLEENGWRLTDASEPRGTHGPVPVLPFDWPRVVRYTSQARKSAQALAERADLGWREIVREGLLAGLGATTLAELTGLTPQRIYQVRDHRR